MIRTILVCLLLIGCHGRLKRSAPGIEVVAIAVHNERPARIDIADFGEDSETLGMWAATAWAMALVSEEARVAQTVARTIDRERVDVALGYGVREALGPGPPFQAADTAPARLTIDVRRWGLEVNGVSAPSSFSLRARVLGTRDGRTFYRSGLICLVGIGTLRAQASLGAQDAFDRGAFACGAQLVARLRRHAG